MPNFKLLRLLPPGDEFCAGAEYFRDVMDRETPVDLLRSAERAETARRGCSRVVTCHYHPMDRVAYLNNILSQHTF